MIVSPRAFAVAYFGLDFDTPRDEEYFDLVRSSARVEWKRTFGDHPTVRTSPHRLQLYSTLDDASLV